MNIHLLITLLGLVAGFLLFWRLPYVGSATGENGLAQKVSVIIPARNEEASLGLLLEDLQAQTTAPLEIIVVDDASEDYTSTIARQFEVTLLTVADKPGGWTGKTYACHLGAQKASGEVFLFLDADVRLAPDALQRLCHQFLQCKGTITVQPYHKPGTMAEQLALVFNLIAGCTLASCLPFAHTPGLYGPVLMMNRDTYTAVDGHKAVRTSVVEDLDLGIQLEKAHLPYYRFLGGQGIAFRMYPGGLRDLFQGFVKNFSLGAAKTSWPTLLLIVVWVSALCRVPVELATAFTPQGLAAFGGLYVLCTVQLFWAAGKVGRFRPIAVILYPISLLFFVLVFAVSLYKKLFHRPVRWKGREIHHGREF